jgi:hypothetical protein
LGRPIESTREAIVHHFVRRFVLVLVVVLVLESGHAE